MGEPIERALAKGDLRARRPRRRASSHVQRAVAPRGAGRTTAWVAAGCGGLVAVVTAFLFLWPDDEEPAAAAKPAPPAKAVLASAPEPKAAPTRPLAPGAQAVYALQDRQNATGLWALVEELRGNAGAVRDLHAAMTRDASEIEGQVRAAVADGGSIPLDQRIFPEDELTSVNGLQVWADYSRLRETARKLEAILRGLKEGETLTVRLRRGGNPMEHTIAFRGKPSWPAR